MSPKPKPKPGQPSALEKMRARTNYNAKRITGFAPLFDAALADASRLAEGSAFKILIFIYTKSLGRRVAQTDPFMEVTEPISIAELAELARCDRRTAERELNGLVERKVIGRAKVKGLYEFQPLFRSWASLPDYAARPQSEPEVAVDEPEEVQEEIATKDKTVTRVTERPVFVRAGKKSKPVKVECGVTALQFTADIDADCSAVVQGGTLLVSLQQKEKPKSNIGRQNEINDLTSNSRHGRRFSPSETEGKETKGERRTNSEDTITGGQSSQKGTRYQSNGASPVQHPRSEELSSLFDEFLLRSCGKSLSEDHVALLAACEAIADVPHDFVVKVVVDRAARPISSPRAAVAICREIAGNWVRAKDLPPAKKLPTHEEIEAMCKREKLELDAERKRKRTA